MNIEYLADHKDTIPTLARWHFDEWSYLHPERTLSDVERLISGKTNKEHIPISLVAMEKDKVIGAIELKTDDFKGRPDLNPWLSSLYVDKPHRRKGVATKLVHELEGLAARLGVSKLFLITDNAEKFYSRHCWNVHERTVWQKISITVMEKDIAGMR